MSDTPVTCLHVQAKLHTYLASPVKTYSDQPPIRPIILKERTLYDAAKKLRGRADMSYGWDITLLSDKGRVQTNAN